MRQQSVCRSPQALRRFALGLKPFGTLIAQWKGIHLVALIPPGAVSIFANLGNGNPRFQLRNRYDAQN